MVKKRDSKRKSLRKQHKIAKKVHEHHKKIKKFNRKHPEKKRRIKKDPGIPNLYHFKHSLLQKIMKKKEEEEEKNERKKNKKKRDKEREKKIKERQKNKQHDQFMENRNINNNDNDNEMEIDSDDDNEDMGFGNNNNQSKKISQMAKLQMDAQQKNKDYQSKMFLLGTEEEEKLKKEGVKVLKEKSYSKNTSRLYYKEFKKVVETSDVIIEVLDARDPLGCRAFDIEKTILSSHPDKKIVLLLNKIDLVPREVNQKWLTHLKNDFPTIAFKSVTTKQKSKTSYSESDSNNIMSSGTSIGNTNLIQLLKNYCRSHDIKKNIVVGIIGYPNVGKSSVINSLKRGKVAGVGSTPGFTRTTQEIQLDSNIKLIDCPGIIFNSKKKNQLDSEIILRNAVRIETLTDTVTPVDMIIKRCNKDRFLERYGVPPFKTTEEFLSKLAIKKGLLKKGNKPRINEAGKIVLRDWNSGKIPFFTLPPKDDTIINKINKFNKMDIEDLGQIPTMKDRIHEKLFPIMPSKKIEVESDDEEDDEYDYAKDLAQSDNEDDDEDEDSDDDMI